MGILKRFKDIMSANVNALLDKAEDPSKMIDQYLRDLEKDLSNVKAETASIMAEEKRTKRAVEECQHEIDRLQNLAKKALTAGNEDDAKVFLEKKVSLTEKSQTLQQAYDLAKSNAVKMREMHDKLVSDISQLNNRRDSIKAKVAMARTQEKMNKIGSSIGNVNSNMSAFDRMEAKANKLLDEANAMDELSQTAKGTAEELADKYSNAPDDKAVEDELAALKDELGL